MSDTQLIKDKIDIVDLISEYVQLKPSGINHKACCPFHQEKTPSFMVSRERQSWKCFGCDKGGDIFSFIQEMEGMEFLEALKLLAGRAGVELTHRGAEINTNKRNRLKDVNTEAARFFNNFLLKMSASKLALDYLHGRGLIETTIEDWQIGYIPEQWDLLTKYLLKKGYSIDDLVESGLTIKRDQANPLSGKGYYDRFRGRIMFPIWDVHGTVVGFTGRVLLETQKSGGKYINSPQSSLYDKSSVVFGLNKAKREIRNRDKIIMVEGQMDVITGHQAGFTNMVASSGTALTEFQIKLLKRYSTNLSMAFDMDEAGQKAAERGIEIALSEGMNIKIIQVPENVGKDPDDCIRMDRKCWERSVDNAVEIMDWYFIRAFKNKNINNAHDKQSIADGLLPKIGLIPFAITRDHWLGELSARLDVDISVLREDMSRLKNEQKKTLIFEKKEIKKKKEEKSKLDNFLGNYFSLILKFPSLYKKHATRINDFVLSTSDYLAVYELIKNMYNIQKCINIDELREQAYNIQTEHEENPVDSLLLQGEWAFSAMDIKEAENELSKTIALIEMEYEHIRKAKLLVEIEKAEKNKNRELAKKLLEEYQK